MFCWTTDTDETISAAVLVRRGTGLRRYDGLGRKPMKMPARGKTSSNAVTSYPMVRTSFQVSAMNRVMCAAFPGRSQRSSNSFGQGGVGPTVSDQTLSCFRVPFVASGDRGVLDLHGAVGLADLAFEAESRHDAEVFGEGV